MKKIKRYSRIIVIFIAFGLCLARAATISPMARAAQPMVDLKTATPFAILAGTPNITDVANSSNITGNVGLSPATGAGIGLLCSQVTGSIY